MTDRPLEVLIVDDDPNFRRTLKDILRAKGFQAESVASGEAALERVGAHEPLVALIDLKLEDIPGLELIRRIKEQAPQVECIVLTGYASGDSAIEAVNLGAYSYFKKPYDVEHLLVTVRRAVEAARARAELERLQAFNQEIVQNVSEGITVVDAAGTFIFLNPAACDLFGCEMGGLLGHHWHEVVPEDQRLQVEQALEAFLRGEPARYELQIQRLDGKRVDVLASGQPRFEGETFAGVLTVLYDLSELKQMRKAVRRSEERYRDLFQRVPVGLYRSTPEGKILEANRAMADLLGFPDLQTLVQTPAHALFVEPQKRKEQINRLMREGEIREDEIQLRRFDRRVIWVRDTARMVRDPESGEVYFDGSLVDITESRRAMEEIRRRVERLRALHTIDQAISSSLDLRVTLQVLLEQVCSQLGMDAADVLLLDPLTHELEFIAGRGFRTPALQSTHLRLGEGYAGQAAAEKKILQVFDLSQDPGDLTRSRYLEQEGFIYYCGVPLLAKATIKGVMEIFHRQAFEPDDEWLEFLQAVALQAAIAIDNALLFTELQDSHFELIQAYDATLEGWSRALDLRDHDTEGHTQRVARMTVELARKMGIPEDEIAHIRRGAILHDIGKMGIPDAILHKPGALDDEEWEIMRQHPVYAYEMLSPIPYLRRSLDIPYCHHEKWDGTGYPRGLKGEEIPLAARIFAVVDVWDALSSDRPYRAAWEPERVRAYLQETHFDPRVVEAFLELIPEDRGQPAGSPTGQDLSKDRDLNGSPAR